MTTRIAAAVLNQTALDIEGNSLRIQRAIEDSVASGAQIICLPELCLTGYGAEDMFLSQGFADRAMDELLNLVPRTRGIVTGIGLPLRYENVVYNCVAVLANGQLVGFVAKQNLARDGLHYEPRWFRQWPVGNVVEYEVRGSVYPLGDLLFEVGSWRIGFEICEDAWVKNRPLARLAARGANLVLNPSASHFAFGKNKVRQRLIQEAVDNFDLVYAYANLLGNEAGRAIYDGDSYIAANGKINAMGDRFSFRDYGVLICDVEKPGGAEISCDLERPGDQAIHVDFEPGEIEGSPALNSQPDDWESSPAIKEEEFTRAVSLGLMDYIRKSRSNGVVVSLSGGADSAAVACLSRLMLDLAWEELGEDVFRRRFDYVPSPATGEGLDYWARQLICTAYQATRNSSKLTRNAAAEVASGIGATHYELEIDEIVQSYKKLVAKAIGRDLEWSHDDISLQNIQARSRSPGIWMFANIRNALLLSTSNRSEAAVGYASMDGDTSGGLAPIAGIDKAFLRNWLRWLETKGPGNRLPYPFLRLVNEQQPTAELRPPSSHQTDEEDLMPYPVLDFIERAAVRDKLMPSEIFPRLKEEFNQSSPLQCVEWIQKFFQLWCRNQWKRERYAPSFHLDDESLDPKTWCRFPILSGGFEKELLELEETVRSNNHLS